MIAVIGGVKTTVRIKLTAPERDIQKQREQDEEALVNAGIDVDKMREGQKEESPEDARFRAYYEAKMREQASESYWDQVGLGGEEFGKYPAVTPGEDSDIKVINSGCSYNVAMLLAQKAGEDKVSFFSVMGDDALGLAARSELKSKGVDISKVKTVEGTTPVSVEICNVMGDTMFCRGNRALMEALTPEYMEEISDMLDKADSIFIDGTVPVDTMNYISQNYSRKAKIFFDPASVQGGVSFRESQLEAECVMPGRREAEAMSEMQVLGMDQLTAASEAFERKGVKKTIITLKGGGLYYRDGAESGIIKPKRRLSFGNTSGCGDIVTAEITWQLHRGAKLSEGAAAGIRAADEYLADVEDVREY